jgi:DNA invertase Pin-like site-specific DNA recombinase
MPQVAIYARVSTADQDCARQISDLTAYAERCGHEVVAIFKETASGRKNDRPERKKIIDLARKRQIVAVMVTELSRWGRSTQDLIGSVRELADRNVSLLALNGQEFDLSTATGKLMLTLLAGISEFERDLLTERINSGLAEARKKGKRLGRPQKSSDDSIRALLTEGQTIRYIANALAVSTTTVQKIKRQVG